MIYVIEKPFLANGQIICCKSANDFDAHLQEMVFQEHWQLNREREGNVPGTKISDLNVNEMYQNTKISRQLLWVFKGCFSPGRPLF